MDEAAVSWRRTVGVIIAFAFCGYGGCARGRPDTPVAAAPDDDLDIRECARVDAHDVRALLHGRRGRRLMLRMNGIPTVRHGER